MQSEPAVYRVVSTLERDFFPYRGLRAAAPPAPSDAVLSAIEGRGFFRLAAARAAPRGARDEVVVLVLGAGSQAATAAPKLRDLLGAELRSGRLDELLVVAPDEFFAKANMTGEFAKFQRVAHDPEGEGPYCDAVSYATFALNLPEHASVPPHRVMEAAEVEALLADIGAQRSALPVIFVSDPPAVWLGAREGQVVEILRASETAIAAPYYRRVERARQ